MAEVTAIDGVGVVGDAQIESSGQKLDRITTSVREKAGRETSLIEERNAMKRGVQVFGDRMCKLMGIAGGKKVTTEGIFPGELKEVEKNALLQAELKLEELGLGGWRKGIAGGQELVSRIKKRYGAVLGEGGDEAAWQEVLSDSPELSVLSNNPGYWENRPADFDRLVAKRKAELLEFGKSPVGKTVSEIASRFVMT